MSSSETHFAGKVTQKALIYHDGKVLLARDFNDDTFDIPGGRLNATEQPQEALQREIKEELGIEVLAGEPVYVCSTVWGRDKTPHFFIAYKAELVSPVSDVHPDGVEVEELRWVTRADLSNIKIYNECAEAIFQYYKKFV